MTPSEFYKENPEEIVAKVATEAKTTLSNFKHIALFNGSVGKALAARLADASNGKMTELEILYPERYQQDSAA